jgi:hypothetical protein
MPKLVRHLVTNVTCSISWCWLWEFYLNPAHLDTTLISINFVLYLQPISPLKQYDIQVLSPANISELVSDLSYLEIGIGICCSRWSAVQPTETLCHSASRDCRADDTLVCSKILPSKFCGFSLWICLPEKALIPMQQGSHTNAVSW